MRRVRLDEGFTLVELMVVVLIIGILVSIAIASFISSQRAAELKTCFSNERVSEGMYQAWRTKNNGLLPVPSDWAGLNAYLVPEYVARTPECPSGGAYSWTTTQSVTCSVHGHY